MSVAIIGAGLQGCCVALELVARGMNVDLFDRAAVPMQGASRAGEGKIHLGYVYAKDFGLATARVMVRGAFRFDDFLRRHLGVIAPAAPCSTPFVYGVHRDSQLGARKVADYFAAVDRLVAEEAANGMSGEYLGEAHLQYSRPVAVERYFDPAKVAAAFQTAERAIDTAVLADAMTTRILAEPRIVFHGGHEVERVERIGSQRFRLACRDGDWISGYQHIVNASWESRLAIDLTFGLNPGRTWLYRYKIGLRVRQSANTAEVPSITIILGPFGDVVNYGGNTIYLSWYPSCRTIVSTAIAPPPLPSRLPPAISAEAVVGPLRQLVPALRAIDVGGASIETYGGWIFAWGRSDIDDTNSELHRRDDVGVYSMSGYHTINTGKLTLAPLHAMTVCDRIAPQS